MRLVLGAGGRRRDPLLRHAGRRRPGQGAHHARRTARAVCSAEGARRRRPRCIRLQQAFIDVQAPQCGYCYNGMTIKGSELLAQEPEADRGADPRPHEWPPLPLRHLSADHEGDPACLHPHGRRGPMNAHQTDPNFSRRDLLKGGGALIVGFSMAGVPAGAALAARGDVAGPPITNAIDTWIAIHADNTATVYFGKCELGQGNTTGLLQIAAEELDLDMSQIYGGAARHQRDAEPGRHQLELLDRARRPAECAPRPPRRGGRCCSSPRPGSACRPAASWSTTASCRSTAQPTPLGHVRRTARRQAVQRRSSPAPRRRSRSTATSWSAPACRASTCRTRSAGKYTLHAASCACPACCTAAWCCRAASAPIGAGAKPLSDRRELDQGHPGARVVRKGDFVGVVAEHEWDAVTRRARA